VDFDRGITAFYFDINTGKSELVWSKTFFPPEFPTGMEYSILDPMVCKSRNDEYILITAISHFSTPEPERGYLIALNATTGNMLWSRILDEPIVGYSYDRNNDMLYVTTVHSLVSLKNINNSTQDWAITYDKSTETSPPTIDQTGNVYICISGSIRGYNNFGSPIFWYEHTSIERYCDQPIILDNAILVRTDPLNPTNSTGLFLTSVIPIPATPTAPPSIHEDNTGLTVGLVIGGLALLALILLVVRISKRRKTERQYDLILG